MNVGIGVQPVVTDHDLALVGNVRGHPGDKYVAVDIEDGRRPPRPRRPRSPGNGCGDETGKNRTPARNDSHTQSGTCRNDGRVPGRGRSAPDVGDDRLPPWRENGIKKRANITDTPASPWKDVMRAARPSPFSVQVRDLRRALSLSRGVTTPVAMFRTWMPFPAWP